MKGTVKWYNTMKGYGFIVGEDDKDYFVHVTFLPQGVEELKDGEGVEFTPTIGENGKRQAKEIKL